MTVHRGKWSCHDFIRKVVNKDDVGSFKRRDTLMGKVARMTRIAGF